jgi:precorrin-3B synthase
MLTLHPARDGHVARIRIPGGYVTGSQWTALAAMAGDLGDGHLDLTSRANVQLRGLRAAAAATLADRAAAAGLLPSGTHDRARNVTASPLAGLGGRPPLRDLVRRLDAAIVADRSLAALPGRFLFAVDDGTGGAGLARCDIGLRRTGRQVELIIAGRRAHVQLPVAAAAQAAAAAAGAAVSSGVGSTITRVAGLADRGAAVAAVIGGSLGETVVDDDRRLPLGVPDAAGVVVAGARLCRLETAQMEILGSLLRQGETIRLAAAGRIVLPLDGTAGRALARLTESGLLTSNEAGMAGVTACSGMACSRSLADVRTQARPLARHPVTHWAGCGRGCGRPQDAELLVATGPATFVVAGQEAGVTWPAAVS